jgi:hypothetical protein
MSRSDRITDVGPLNILKWQILNDIGGTSRFIFSKAKKKEGNNKKE